MSTTSSASTPAPRPPTSTTSESQSLYGEEVESIPVENPQQQGTKRKTTSDVWNHFKKKNIDGKVKAQCNYCGKLMAGASTSGTTHLKLHIAKSCPSAPKEALPGEGTDIRKQVLVKQHNRARSKGISSPSVFNEEDQKASRRDLARMVILHEYPLAIVDHVGFRDFVVGLQSNFKIVGRNTLKRDIKKIYNEKKQKTMVEIDKNASKVAITTDLWTANNSKRSFMVITAHYINDSWTLESRVIRFIRMPSPHDKYSLSKILLNNASNNDGMMKLVSDKLQASSLILGGKLLHVRCAAHILNLVVQEGLNVIGDGIEKVRSSVYFWTQSPKRIEIFEKISRQSHIASTKELVLDCRTRWNSTYLMLSTALIYKDVFPRLLCCEPQYQSAPTNRDWEVAQIVCEKLGYFHKVTELLSSTAYPTANHYFPSVFWLKLELNQWLSSEDELVKKMAAKMLAKFDKYWSDVHDIMSLAIVLDPRYKLMLLTFYFNKMYGSNANDEIDKVKNLLFESFADYDLEKCCLSALDVGEPIPFKPFTNRFPTPYRASGSTAPYWYSFKRGPAYVIVMDAYSGFGVGLK
ncbi:zinc finger BED domain-containing protein RICESLEEPER 2-like [Quercus suber]|uniref:zinc finger BED domain-containing protein RICESLEEPER 2-like n=1 Tax=Quercus suber TaxID=58331 RepID=UPI0032DFB463